jgi:hypothetical protein
MHFLYGLISSTIAIVATEMLFNYSLGDSLRDVAAGILHGAEAKVRSKFQRAEARYKAAVSEAKERTGLRAL